MPDDGPTSKSSDTSFRRTWDRGEYAQKAATRESAIKEEGKARAEAKAAGRKYIPSRDVSSLEDSSSRAARLDVAANIGKTTLVPSGAATGKRGKGAGFYCQECDLTFKDNLQFVEHLNSRQHLVNTGQSGEVRRATLEEVRERLAWLLQKRRDEQREVTATDLRDRLLLRAEEEETLREEKRRARREKRRKTEGGVGVKLEEGGYGGGVIS